MRIMEGKPVGEGTMPMPYSTGVIGGSREVPLYVDEERRVWKSFLITPDNKFYLDFLFDFSDLDRVYVRERPQDVPYKVQEPWPVDSQHWFTIGDQQWLGTVKKVTPSLRDLKNLVLSSSGVSYDGIPTIAGTNLCRWSLEGEINDIDIVPAEIAQLRSEIPIGNLI